MTKLMEHTLEGLRILPKRRQRDVTEFLMAVTQHEVTPFHLSPDQVRQVKKSMRQAREGKFASDKQVAAMWKSFGL